jgi:sensor domain CHASE-containing protein
LTVRLKVLVILAATAVAMLGTLYVAADYVILSPFLRQEQLTASAGRDCWKDAGIA